MLLWTPDENPAPGALPLWGTAGQMRWSALQPTSGTAPSTTGVLSLSASGSPSYVAGTFEGQVLSWDATAGSWTARGDVRRIRKLLEEMVLRLSELHALPSTRDLGELHAMLQEAGI